MLYSAQYHIKHYTIWTFDQFQSLYLHKDDDKHLVRYFVYKVDDIRV